MQKTEEKRREKEGLKFSEETKKKKNFTKFETKNLKGRREAATKILFWNSSKVKKKKPQKSGGVEQWTNLAATFILPSTMAIVDCNTAVYVADLKLATKHRHRI